MLMSSPRQPAGTGLREAGRGTSSPGGSCPDANTSQDGTGRAPSCPGAAEPPGPAAGDGCAVCGAASPAVFPHFLASSHGGFKSKVVGHQTSAPTTAEEHFNPRMPSSDCPGPAGAWCPMPGVTSHRAEMLRGRNAPRACALLRVPKAQSRRRCHPQALLGKTAPPGAAFSPSLLTFAGPMAAQAHPCYVLYLQPPTARCRSLAQHRELLGMGEITARSQPPAPRRPVPNPARHRAAPAAHGEAILSSGHGPALHDSRDGTPSRSVTGQEMLPQLPDDVSF